MAHRDVPETQHARMRARQGRVFVESAADQLYFCALKCREDGFPWPKDLDDAHALLWAHLGREEAHRRSLVGGGGGGDGETHAEEDAAERARIAASEEAQRQEHTRADP